MLIKILYVLACAVVAVWTIWTCLSSKYEDGVIGTLLAAGVCLAVVCCGYHAATQEQKPDWSEFALVMFLAGHCIFHIVATYLRPIAIKRRPEMSRRDVLRSDPVNEAIHENQN